METPYGALQAGGRADLRESGLPRVVVRPGHVYGAGGWYAEEIVKRLRQPGRFAVIGTGDNWWDVVRVEDVAPRSSTRRSGARTARSTTSPTTSRSRLYDFIALTAERARRGPAAAHARRASRASSPARTPWPRSALGALLERPDQARARLDTALPDRAEGVPDADREAGKPSLSHNSVSWLGTQE